MSRPLKVALLQLQAFDLAQHEAAWEEMRKRMTELDVAVYKQKYRLS